MADVTDTPARADADARAWFYLDHRRDIEEWAALRPEAAAFLHTRLLELGPQVEDLAVELGAEPYDADLDDGGGLPRIGLRHQQWVSNGHPVAVVVEWKPSALLDPHSGDRWPYVAVRNDGGTQDSVRRQQLTDLFTAVRKVHHGSSGTPWPFWRYVLPAPGPGVDPDALVRACVAQLRQLWEIASPLLDGAHPAPATAGRPVPGS